MTIIKKYRIPFLAVLGLLTLALVLAAMSPQSAEAAGPEGHGRADKRGAQHDQYLAEALGITVEELQAAREQAFEAALQQAVDQGLITEKQAEWLKEHKRAAQGLRRFAPFGAENIDMNALLADALGISVDELQAARRAAADAALDQAVAEGRITQERADRIKAMRALKAYFQEQGVRDQLRAVIENAVQQAVADGVITQEQADEFLSRPGIIFPGMKRPQPKNPGMNPFRGRSCPQERGFQGQSFPGFSPSTSPFSNSGL
ncbi:MAG: hypothetical protein GXP42_07960 [Chloroflexi bacterium]|nr:hypothetical protein [Chloroflexota bacterium]